MAYQVILEPGIGQFREFESPRVHTSKRLEDNLIRVAYQVIILGPGIGQFREFESPRVHTSGNSWGLFLAQIDLRKARERELATLDEKSTSSGIAEPYARCKLKARTGGGGKGRHL